MFAWCGGSWFHDAVRTAFFSLQLFFVRGDVFVCQCVSLSVCVYVCRGECKSTSTAKAQSNNRMADGDEEADKRVYASKDYWEQRYKRKLQSGDEATATVEGGVLSPTATGEGPTAAAAAGDEAVNGRARKRQSHSDLPSASAGREAVCSRRWRHYWLHAACLLLMLKWSEML